MIFVHTFTNADKLLSTELKYKRLVLCMKLKSYFFQLYPQCNIFWPLLLSLELFFHTWVP